MLKNIKEIFFKINKCKKCFLYKTRTKIVFDNYCSNKNPIIFIGEAPGGHEDFISGIPFSGKAGINFRKLLKLINLKRNNIYITNLVKCRPTKYSSKPIYGNYANRKPTKKEIDICSKYINEEINFFDAKIIVTLGVIPFNYFFKKLFLKKEHGKELKLKNKIFFPLYHPASLIYNKKIKKIYMNDLYKFKEYLENNYEYI